MRNSDKVGRSEGNDGGKYRTARIGDVFTHAEGYSDENNRSQTNSDDFDRVARNSDNVVRAGRNDGGMHRTVKSGGEFTDAEGNSDENNRSLGNRDDFDRAVRNSDSVSRAGRNNSGICRTERIGGEFNHAERNSDGYNRSLRTSDDFDRVACSNDKVSRAGRNGGELSRTARNRGAFTHAERTNDVISRAPRNSDDLSWQTRNKEDLSLTGRNGGRTSRTTRDSDESSRTTRDSDESSRPARSGGELSGDPPRSLDDTGHSSTVQRAVGKAFITRSQSPLSTDSSLASSGSAVAQSDFRDSEAGPEVALLTSGLFSPAEALLQEMSVTGVLGVNGSAAPPLAGVTPDPRPARPDPRQRRSDPTAGLQKRHSWLEYQADHIALPRSLDVDGLSLQRPLLDGDLGGPPSRPTAVVSGDQLTGRP
ncbi:translation initiation factor IF-2-like [Pollicipes pollicipes]|uniref:translation initiation factor IF-2-like n=1 Tax=Pollicipes pollicipes TaxID=41117 RepID=UPI001884DDBF|nr:translation initiation factor IF-2-like [Pollicipes pollicipes]